MKDNKIYIYGKHAVREAIKHAPHILEHVYISPDNSNNDLRREIKKAGIKLSNLGSDKGSKQVMNKESHQGVVGRIAASKIVIPYKNFIESLKINSDSALIILGEIQDPHNVGAIIRSAAAFGISGVLLPKHNQAPVSGAVVKVSAGMAFKIPIVEINNINMVIRDLKDRGFWIYGLDGGGDETTMDETYDEPAVFVLGNESVGLRQKTALVCDKILSIPIHNRCESLNVASSCAIAMYDWSTKHPNAIGKT